MRPGRNTYALCVSVMKYKTIFGKATKTKIKSNGKLYCLKRLNSFNGFGYFMIKNTYAGGWEIIRIFPIESVNVVVGDVV